MMTNGAVSDMAWPQCTVVHSVCFFFPSEVHVTARAKQVCVCVLMEATTHTCDTLFQGDEITLSGSHPTCNALVFGGFVCLSTKGAATREMNARFKIMPVTIKITSKLGY